MAKSVPLSSSKADASAAIGDGGVYSTGSSMANFAAQLKDKFLGLFSCGDRRTGANKDDDAPDEEPAGHQARFLRVTNQTPCLRTVAVPVKATIPPEAIKLNAMEESTAALRHRRTVPPVRSSLSATLANNFAPLASKLVHLAETGDVAIRRPTSDDDGVKFVGAESDADVRRLSGDEEHDLDMSVLPAPVLAVQATRLRHVLRKYTHNLPVVMTSPLIPPPAAFTAWTFTLDAHDIERLKHRIVCLGGEPQPSTFVPVVALAWTCLVRYRSVVPGDDVFLLFFADVRDRLDPPAGADYFGTCLSRCFTKLPARELHGERALAAAAAQGGIREMAEDAVAGWEFMRGIAIGTDGLSMDRLVHVSGSSRYEAADFGWGRPSLTVPARMNPDGQVALFSARDGHGVQVSVSMPHRDDQPFKSLFLQLLSRPDE
ncbi:hypothetical protein HU200_014351 [Digitaria exilis]|uniref:Uncharacterized protein n=1 Tax=Digitaria exilis TaxID=1010633 RepID=A0A835KKC1_9POAL|nr:hypothetical protein HU200_014351 [Digitaria exilis]